MQSANPLIRTKLRQPFTRPGLVSRPRLQTQIAGGLLAPLTLVIAPAGFGKTTLVASSLAGCGMPVAWLSLDKEDNQAGRFLTYLVAALQTADQRIGSEAAQLMAGMHQALPESVLTSLINDLDAASGEMVLVLDDYQFISSPEVHAAMTFLLDHCPHNFHVLIVTRSDPPLPVARLRARGQMVELRAADLRFTAPEAAQFLNVVMGLHLDAGLITMLEEHTEGWVAGLQMAALSMRERGDVATFIKGFSGTNRHVLDYLLEEILASQPPEIQQFLLYTSILTRLSAPLCDAVLADDEKTEHGNDSTRFHSGSPSLHKSASVLEYLERENLFLISLDDERIWFRYHHLFGDLLKAQLRQAHPDLVPVLLIRASAWLEQNGFILEAIQHLFAAHEDSRAADLIEHYGPLRWAESDPSIIQIAVKLPPELLITRPIIGFYQAWLLILQGNVEKAIPLLTDMAQRLTDANSNSGVHWIQTMVALALAFLGWRSSTPGVDLLPDYQALDEIPANELALSDAAVILYGLTLGRRGEIDRAAEIAAKSVQREKSPHGTLVIPSLVPFLGRIYLVQGRLHAAASLCREYLDPIQEKGMRFIYSSGNMNIILGEVLYERNCLYEAEQQIRDGLRANEPWVDIITDAFGLLAMARILCAKGDYAGAMLIVDKFETRLQGQFRPFEFQEDFRTLRVRVQLNFGDLQNPSYWADQVQHNEDFPIHPVWYLQTLARIRLAQGRYADVEEMLAGISTLAAAGNRITRHIESNLLLAAAIAGQQRMPEALGLIESSLALAEPEGYIQIFLNVGEAARNLLSAYLRLDAPGHARYAQKVLDSFSSTGGACSHGPRPTGLIEPLSGRELEVLHLMALGRTNKEIARQLIVAPGTIKAHAARIYRKLDVANRTEAVAHARELGILT